MIAQLPNLNEILKRHEIPPKFWEEIRGFVEENKKPSAEVLTRLRHVANYQAAYAEINAELRAGFPHKLAPASWRTPAGYPVYAESFVPESLTPEDVVLATSSGCAVRSPLSNQTLSPPGVGISSRCQSALIDG